MSQFDNVSVIKKANAYFDGKCVRHSGVLAGGTSFKVAANSSFDIEVLEALDYVCHFE